MEHVPRPRGSKKHRWQGGGGSQFPSWPPFLLALPSCPAHPSPHAAPLRSGLCHFREMI